MKKTLLGMLFICGITNQLAFSMGIEATATVPALFSLERLKLARNSFTRALDKYKRCLVAGGCTAQEYEQVKRTVNTAGKTALALIAAYLTYTRGLPKVKAYSKARFKEAKAELKKTAGEVAEEMVAKATAQATKDVQKIVEAAGEGGKVIIADLLKKEGTVEEATERLLGIVKAQALGLTDEAIKQKLSPFLGGLKVQFSMSGVTFDLPKEEKREEEEEEMETQGLVGFQSLSQQGEEDPLIQTSLFD